MPSVPATFDATTDVGPAFNALRPAWRAFVVAYCTNGCNAAEAVIEAGASKSSNREYIAQQAWRLTHHPEVLAAIRELTLAGIKSDLPRFREALNKMVADPQHKDHYKAVIVLTNRGGLAEVIEKNINVNVRTTDEKLARVRELAEKHGIPIATVLGTVTDAEFQDVTPAKPSPEDWKISDEDY